ncbi:MAG TPA: SRPBCC family protein [Verrucomicrobiae bacterium]|jgi:uncharacterized membrane protein
MKPRSSAIASSRSNRESIPARRSAASVRDGKGVKAEITLTINRPAEELFAFWRNFENLPRVMEHVESVQCLDERRSHWRARRSTTEQIEWTADVINERPNELIAWRTLEGSDVQHAGSIRFAAAPGGFGTEVKLAVEYETSGFADMLAKLGRRSPAQQMREDLRHFKQLMEAGEIPTTTGQPAGRTKDVVPKYEEAK